jgi:hypothetical protein
MPIRSLRTVTKPRDYLESEQQSMKILRFMPDEGAPSVEEGRAETGWSVQGKEGAGTPHSTHPFIVKENMSNF